MDIEPFTLSKWGYHVFGLASIHILIDSFCCWIILFVKCKGRLHWSLLMLLLSFQIIFFCWEMFTSLTVHHVQIHETISGVQPVIFKYLLELLGSLIF